MTADATLNFCKQENIRMNSWLEQQLKQDNQKPFLYTSYAVQKTSSYSWCQSPSETDT